MRQDQYILKNIYNPPINITSKKAKNIYDLDLYENIKINEKGDPESDGLISFFNPAHIYCLLCNYL